MSDGACKRATLPRNDFEVVPVPKNLKQELGPGRGFDRAGLERAQAAVAALQSEYESRLVQELREFEATLATMRALGDLDRAALYVRARELRAEGGSHGYSLITDYADSLANYLEGGEPPEAVDIAIVETHLSALLAVAHNRVRGGGGQTAKELGENLRRLAAGSAE
jgi:hypothetical protein